MRFLIQGLSVNTNMCEIRDIPNLIISFAEKLVLERSDNPGL